MRRFSSEGSLMGLDLVPWKSVSLKDKHCDEVDGSGTYRTTAHLGNEVDLGAASLPSTLGALQNAVSRQENEFSKKLSFSVNLTDLDISPGLLKVTNLNESFKAYSDSQLAPCATSSSESVEKDDDVSSPSPSSTSTLNHLCFHTGSSSNQHRPHVRAKLAAAKLHLKSLFAQSPHSSHSNLTALDHRERENSAKERRSRFLKQWSQVGHAKTRLSREQLQKWAESLDVVLESRVGVAVFGAFLRSEFSEENLQFYLACEQYRHSSNNFSLGRRAKEISTTYIQPGAPREVNLDSKTRELTLQLLKAPSHNCLCHAQKRIRSLLETDCYPRFLQSNIYLMLLQDAYKENMGHGDDQMACN